MRVGLVLPALVPGSDAGVVLDWARAAEEGPFSHLAVIDRIKFGNYEPLITLAAASAVTSTIRLATTVLASPIRNTAVLAKELATLDRLSGGRLVAGLGLGARADDYEASGVSTKGRGVRLSEQIEEMRAIWEGDEIGPEPAQRGGPVIIVGGNSPEAFARMARFADGYIHGGGPPRIFARAAEQARSAWVDFDRPGRPELWGQAYFAIGDDDVAQRGADYLRDYYAFTGPFAEKIAQGLLTRPQAIVEFIRGYEEAGCDELSLLPAVTDADQLGRLMDVLSGMDLDVRPAVPVA